MKKKTHPDMMNKGFEFCGNMCKDSSPQEKGKTKASLDDLEKNDCYFPLDGYDYNKHLKSVNPCFVIEAKTAPKIEESDIEEGDEELDDDFVVQALRDENEADDDENEADDNLEEFDELVRSDVSVISNTEDEEINNFLKEFQEDCGELSETDERTQGVFDVNHFLIKDYITDNSTKTWKSEDPLPKELLLRFANMPDEEFVEEPIVHRDETEQWDVETILTTRSTLFNHPHLVARPPRIIKVPNRLDKLRKEFLPEKVEQNIQEEPIEMPQIVTYRPKKETPEEKRERKHAFKNGKKLVRQSKSEAKKQIKKEGPKIMNNLEGITCIRL
eukprot:GHVL01015260.1.p1 GENE.GHVL01015260.1~~GHVL01015260.1.p1  ORF type:complete len:330 (-),score=90.74 GHVL01015260.1:50-1039(-)